MNLRKPPAAGKGDIIRIISPSAGIMPFVQERVKRSAQNLTSVGFKVLIADNAGKNNNYVSGSIEERVLDIHTAFNDDKCSIIMAAIGGNHSNQLINHLDYNLIRKNPKTFIGYSDNTILHYALATKANLQTFYGPCFLNQFGEFPEVLPYTLDYFKKAIIEQAQEINVLPSKEYTDEVLDWFRNEDSKRKRNMKKKLWL